MADLRELMQQHGLGYIRTNTENLGSQQKRVVRAIAHCQTGTLGRAVYECQQCGTTKVMDSSCGNRHCPRCQQQKSLLWCQQQEAKRLPVEYHLVTFTIPESLRKTVLHLRESAYRHMFEASAEVIREVLEAKYGITSPGFTSVLHTWGSELQYHPHIHILLPGGGMDSEKQWVSLPTGFGIPIHAAAKLWMGKLLNRLEKEVGREQLPKQIAAEKFIVHNQVSGDGINAIRYLSRYVFRTAISDSRILNINNDYVTFKAKRKNKSVIMKLHPSEFLKRYLRHILRSGFMRVRHYGFLHQGSRIDLDSLRIKAMQFSEQLLEMLPEKVELEVSPQKRPTCRSCGEQMVVSQVTRALYIVNSS